MKPARPMSASTNPALLAQAIDLHQQGQLRQAGLVGAMVLAKG